MRDVPLSFRSAKELRARAEMLLAGPQWLCETSACRKHSPTDYKNFLKIAKRLFLNGIIEPCWKGWMLSDPSIFFNPEVLHHFHRMFWDHDVQWCIHVIGDTELDFRFSIIQTPVGYCAFDEGMSKLKQVAGRDHRTVQHYIIMWRCCREGST